MNRRDLNRLKNAVIKITLDSRQRVNDIAIADGKADPPTRHVIALGKRKELHPKLFGAGHLKKAGRLITVESKIGVRQVVHDDQFVLPRESNDPLEEIQLDNFRGGIMRKTDNEQLGLRPALSDRRFETAQKRLTGGERNTTQITAGQNDGILMNRIGWTRTKNHVAGVHDRPCEMRYPFFRADGDDRLRIRIDVYLIAPLVPIRNGNPEPIDPSRNGITMVLRFTCRFD